MSNVINILGESCGGCPMIWDLTLPDGSPGYIKYRWGIISLKPVTEKPGLFQEAIIEEQIGDPYDGTLSLVAAVKWLEANGYSVSLDNYL
jgi:hypothetical protein